MPHPEKAAEVDTRFLLANERTLLAWVRTSLALLAAAGGVQQFTDVTGRTAIAVLLAVAGIGAALAGAVRYRRTAAFLHTGVPPSPSPSPVLLAGGVAAIGIALLVALLVT